ncbi:hypothetical protein EYZ11_005867 [Aspergillus tanneri]|uniref:Uncharacterized protein n=1 Tax=Aspergillus tanneri TaxID=1220188 RepID=A0A4S3JHF5_9EURO|nr:hypothetical protein EYZ11_005867 [Aspergillus tanneri]
MRNNNLHSRPSDLKFGHFYPIYLAYPSMLNLIPKISKIIRFARAGKRTPPVASRRVSISRRDRDPHTQALDLLLNILTSSTELPTSVFVPSPQHLAIAATFLVHPSTTTCAKTIEEEEAPNASLRLLRLTNTLAGPISANFRLAFSFTHFESSRQGRRRHEHDSDDDMKPLNLHLGQSSSVWSRAEDFWHAVGWALNCSVLHRERWQRWQTWLEFMCEVLEDDWNERIRLHTSTEQGAEKGGDDSKILKDSLILRYITEGTGGYGRNRRILRAIFADGGSGSVNEFREVFHKELKQRKRGGENVKKREVEVNIDEEQYGDYLANDDDDEDGSSPGQTDNTTAKAKRPTRQSKRPRRGTRSKDAHAHANNDAQTTTHTNGDVALFGGFPSLALRQRLLHLLSSVSQHLPKCFVSLEELYHLFAENIRHLPLPTFQALVSPSILPYFSSAAQTTLCEFLLFRMRESHAADSDEQYLNQTKLVRCFLPYAANTSSITDNAKISITLESLLMLLAESDMLTVTPELQGAVQTGILARADKAQAESKKSQNSRKYEDVEWCWLLESGERLMFLVNEILPHAKKT